MRLDPLIVHALPSAPTFTGRDRELDALREFWHQPSGVLSLVGLGGAGKTALAERFIQWVVEHDGPDGLVVWSFYDEPDANAFLQTTYHYLTGGRRADARGAGWFHLLKEALSDGGRYLLVLDGLERVQRQRTDASGIYGEMEDPLLRGFLTRIATGAGLAKAIVTSRFPVADVERWRGRGYTLVDVDSLTNEAGRWLLRAHGIAASDATLDHMIGVYGGHALTLDLLGGAAARFFGGDPERAIESTEAAPSDAPQEVRLQRVLRIYERHLPERELALLCRLCIFRFGVDVNALESIFIGPGKETIAGALAEASRDELGEFVEALVRGHLALRDGRGRYTVHPAVRDHFYRLFRDPATMHAAVREHFDSLTRRPGIGLPSDKATLDLLEELIYHAIQAGDISQAAEIYLHRLGGNDHLNAHLGEYVRTHRILRAFPDCPDRSGMYHCLRAFGRFEEALQWRPRNTHIRILTGHLTDLRNDRADATRRCALFLQGDHVEIPDRTPDCPLPAAMLHLIRNAVEDARRAADRERSMSLYQDDIARNDLAMAEAERLEGRHQRCRDILAAVSVWILNSGSQEHLVLLHVLRARVALGDRQLKAARSAIDEGLHTAIECDFALPRIDLLVELCQLEMLEERSGEAEKKSTEAIALARRPECGYAWGEARAMQWLGEAQAAHGALAEASATFAETLALRRRISDPAALVTERALRQIEERLAERV